MEAESDGRTAWRTPRENHVCEDITQNLIYLGNKSIDEPRSIVESDGKIGYKKSEVIDSFGDS